MTSTRAFRPFFHLGSAFFLAGAAGAIGSVIDLTALAYYSDATGLIAASLANPVLDVLSALVAASVVGFQIVAPKRSAAGEADGLHTDHVATLRFAGTCWTILTAAAVAIMPIYVGIGVGEPRNVVVLATVYSSIRCLGILLSGIPYATYGAILASFGYPGPIYISAAIMIVSNAVLDFFVVVTAPWSFGLGAVGSALATLISVAVTVLYLRHAAEVRVGRRAVDSSGMLTRRLVNSSYRRLARMSAPLMISAGADYTGNLIMFWMVGGLISNAGGLSLAAVRYGFELQVLVAFVLLSYGAASRVVVTKEIVVNGMASGLRMWRQLTLIIVLFGILLGLTALALRPIFAQLLSQDAQVKDIVDRAMDWVSVSCVLIALAGSVSGLLRAFELTRLEMWSNILPQWLIAVPLCLILSVANTDVASAIFLPLTLYWVFRVLLGLIFVRSRPAQG